MTSRPSLLALAIVIPLACSGGDKPAGRPPGPQDDTGAPDDTADSGDTAPPPPVDSDGDGYFAWIDDCDDADPTVNSGADELPGNTVDEDCDGSDAGPTRDLAEAQTTWDGETWSTTGLQVIHGGDVDGDGVDDLLIGAPWELMRGEFPSPPGAVYIVPASMTSGSITRATAVIVPTEEAAGTGRQIAGGRDIDQDGYDDVLVGMPFSFFPLGSQVDGKALLFFGPLLGTLDEFQADAELRCSFKDCSFGLGVGLFEPGESGSAVLSVSAYHATAADQPVVFMWEAGPEGELWQDSASYLVRGENSRGSMGQRVAGNADLTGDGIHDLVISEGESSVLAPWAGSVHLVAGPLDHDMDIATDATSLLGSRTDAGASDGILVHPDTDGDGYADLVVSGPLDPEIETRGGKVWLVRGPILEGGALDERAHAAVLPEQGYEWLGIGLAAIADLDGDGLSDLAVSAPRDPYFAADLAGKVYLFPGTLQGTVSGQAALLVLQGEHFGDFAGSSLAGGFDANGDGRFDLAIGAPYHDLSSHGEDYGSGLVYLFTDLRP